jgi:hypothetical protein
MSDERLHPDPRFRKAPEGTVRHLTEDEARGVQLGMQIYHQQLEGTRRQRTAQATSARVAKADAMAARAAKLHSAGLSAPIIGMRLAREDGRPDEPYGERQVRRWLARAKKG